MEIEIVSKHLKPHISKILNEVLRVNQSSAKTICDHIIAEQNEINIKESTKETKIKRIAVIYQSIFIIDNHFIVLKLQ